MTHVRMARHGREPATFQALVFHMNGPYALVDATMGEAGMEVLLAKRAGSWRVAGLGGGTMDRSVAEAFAFRRRMRAARSPLARLECDVPFMGRSGRSTFAFGVVSRR